MWRPWREIRGDVSILQRGGVVYGPELKICNTCDAKGTKPKATHLVALVTKGAIWHYTRIIRDLESETSIGLTFCWRRFEYRKVDL